MKKAKVNYDGMIKQVDTLMPDELKEPTKKVFGICKDSSKFRLLAVFHKIYMCCVLKF